MPCVRIRSTSDILHHLRYHSQAFNVVVYLDYHEGRSLSLYRHIKTLQRLLPHKRIYFLLANANALDATYGRRRGILHYPTVCFYHGTYEHTRLSGKIDLTQLQSHLVALRRQSLQLTG